MPLPKASVLPCLPLFIKGPLKEGWDFFAFTFCGFTFGLLDFLLDFWLCAFGGFCFCFFGALLWAFGVGSFWKGKESLNGQIAEGKRIIEGKMLKRG
jgi:hypothetical protein